MIDKDGRGSMDAAAPERIIELLGSDSKHESRRAAAAALSGACDDPSFVARLRSALLDADPRRRWGAAFVLAKAGASDDAVFDAALAALAANDGDVRWAALEIVVDLARRPRERRRRLRALAVDIDDPACKMAVYALRDLDAGDDGVYARALSAKDSGVRLAAISGLARLPTVTERSEKVLILVMESDADMGVRRAAAIALGAAAARSDSARHALERAVATSVDPDLVRAATRALQRA